MPFSFETTSPEEEGSFNQEFDTGEAPTDPRAVALAQQEQVQTQSEADSAAEGVVEGVEEDQRAHDDVYKAMSEVEKRLALAECYKVVLQNDMFSSRTPASVTVQKEVTDFCRRRLENLMGIRPEAPVAVAAQQIQFPFSKEEVMALRALAQATLKRPNIIAKSQDPPPPPSMVPAQVPGNTGPAVPSRPAPPAMAIRPVALRPRPPGPLAAVPTAKPVTRPVASGKKKTREIENPLKPGEKIKIDVTRQVGEARNPHALPMPDKNTMEMLSQHDAMKSVALAGAKLPGILQAGIAHSVNQPANPDQPAQEE